MFCAVLSRFLFCPLCVLAWRGFLFWLGLLFWRWGCFGCFDGVGVLMGRVGGLGEWVGFFRGGVVCGCLGLEVVVLGGCFLWSAGGGVFGFCGFGVARLSAWFGVSCSSVFCLVCG